MVIWVPDFEIIQREPSLATIVRPFLGWAYQGTVIMPYLITVDNTEQLLHRLKFPQVIDGHVKKYGCFVPSRLFKHAAQRFYSKTHAGLDRATKQRAVMWSSTSHFKWEQKLRVYVIRTLAVIAFITRYLFQRQNRLEKNELLKFLDCFSNSLNRLQATADLLVWFLFGNAELCSYYPKKSGDWG